MGQRESHWVMRILIAVLIIISVGTILIADYAFDDRSLKSTELEQVKTNCLKCHRAPPGYPHVTFVHNKHAALQCVVCHGQENGLETMANMQRSLRWAGLGVTVLGLVGILVNYIVMKTRKGK